MARRSHRRPLDRPHQQNEAHQQDEPERDDSEGLADGQVVVRHWLTPAVYGHNIGRMARRDPKTGRTTRIEVRVSPDERAAFDEVAEREGATLADWVRETLLDCAENALSKKK